MLLTVEGGFKKTVIYILLGPVFDDNISKIKLRLEILWVDILSGDNVPDKIKGQDVVHVMLVKLCILVGVLFIIDSLSPYP